MQKVYRPELLAPAGDLEKLKIAIIYGADAVFIGGKKFSLRAKASNFELKDIEEGVIFAHENNSRVHVTVNVYPHSEDLEGLDEYLLELDKINVDAIIVSSPYIVKRARELGCKFEIHISTQQSTANYEAMIFWQNLGANRIVLARELNLKDIEKLKGETNLPLEVFIHGGLCSSFSGRCTLSNNMTLRDANRGGCAHSCRWFYDIYEDNKKINEDTENFRLGSKDLCAAPMINQLIDLKVDSFKIEGRMKSLHYIACVVQAYRQLIDDYLEGNSKDLSYYLSMLSRAENRATTRGFLKGDITYEDGLFEVESEQPSQDFLGIVIDYDKQKKLAKIQQRNH
ncbi:MAG: U32 family peptidase [Bacilli bacterium]|nr:U32 family peptidase [Bacilli bacterium]